MASKKFMDALNLLIEEKGIEKEKTITARKLKSLNISVDTIMQVTGLSAEEIEKL